MKSLIKLVFTLITGSLLFSACSSESKSGKLIPKTAALVIHVDAKSLSSKLSWDDIKQNTWYKELLLDSNLNELQRQIMQDPTVTGIDDKSDLLLFLQMNPGAAGEVVAQGNIKDKKKFEEYYKKMVPGTSVVVQDNINFLPIKDDAVMAWKDDRFMFIGSMEMPARQWDMRMDTSLSMPAAGSSQRLIEAGKKIFALSTDNSLAKDEKFADLLKEEGEVHVYYNVEQMMKASMGTGMVGMINIEKFVAGTISTYTVNFEQGKIVVKSKLYPSKDLAAIFKKYDGGDLDESMLKSIPSQSLAGVMAMTFKPEGIQELVKLTGMDGMLNALLAQMGVTMDDFIKANKGDFLFSITDLNFKRDTTSYNPGFDTAAGYKRPEPFNMLFSLSIGDKPAFEKLLNAWKKAQGDDKDLTYNTNDKYFALSNNPDYVKQFLAGGGSTPVFWDKFKGHGFGMYIDLQNIFKSFRDEIRSDSTAGVILSESEKMWENVYSLGNGFDDGAMSSTTEINLMDKTTNSLKSLNKYFDRISQVVIAEKKKKDDMWNKPDSTLISRDTVAIP